ncbi:MAG: ABC transporter ATP-binding protein, partial [Verrucomicrobiales bacterium]|nr:ABC transporter ATP-binding protein [Verrucomicrobiales bacterium]
DYYCRVHAMGTKAERKARWEECLETVNLTGKRDAWCKKLSRGQTQRLVLAKTLLHRPRVMILDEPASGLDPLSRRDLRFALRRLAEDGVTVFISSHILGELAEMCSSLCVMNLGKILASGTADEVRASLGRSERGLTAVVLGDVGEAVGWLESEEGVHDVKVGDGEVVFGYRGTDEGQAELLAGMIERGARVRSFEESGSSFEDILVDVAEGNRKGGIHV